MRIPQAADRPPSMESLLAHPAAAPLLEIWSRETVKRAVRAVLTSGVSGKAKDIVSRAAERLGVAAIPEIVRVVNATGVLIHTNLGRSPLAPAAIAAISDAARGYQTVEFEIETGQRGTRGRKSAEQVSELLGVEAAHLVNNNAAAVLLALVAIARGREVIVSRGELPAIGGSFKIPEILEASEARLAEVGTTNKTKIADYQKRFSKETAALLTVHPSNYEVRGYTERPTFAEIRAFCRKRRVVWIHDLGSGNLLDLSRFGISGEEKASDAIKAGADLICFSGDKLFGGPQIGVLAGKKKLVEICRKHPLSRALRCDKLTLAAFFATVTLWLRGKPEELPIFALAAVPLDELHHRAAAIAETLPRKISSRVVETLALFGGGTTPEKSMPSIGLSVSVEGLSAADLAARLRAATPPVIARVEGGRVILDLRAVFPEEDELIRAALGSF